MFIVEQGASSSVDGRVTPQPAQYLKVAHVHDEWLCVKAWCHILPEVRNPIAVQWTQHRAIASAAGQRHSAVSRHEVQMSLMSLRDSSRPALLGVYRPGLETLGAAWYAFGDGREEPCR
jgi:hypothetical protein